MALTKVTYSMIDGAAINVADLGAVADNTTDCGPAIQAALDAVAASGGTIYFPPSSGTYYVGTQPTAPDNTTNMIRLVGYGANIRVNANISFIGVSTAPTGTTTRGNISFEGFHVDANRVAGHVDTGAGQQAIIYGATGTASINVQYVNVFIKDITTINCADNTKSFILATDPSTLTTVLQSSNIVVENLRQVDGSHIVFCGYNLATPQNSLTYVDGVYVKNCHHVTSNGLYGGNSHIMIGGGSILTNLEIDGFYGEGANDVGIEINNAVSGSIKNVKIKNADNNAMYFRNRNTNIVNYECSLSIENIDVTTDGAVTAAVSTGVGIAEDSAGLFASTTLSVKNVTYYATGAVSTGFVQQGIGFYAGAVTTIKNLIIDGMTITTSAVTYTATDPLVKFIFVPNSGRISISNVAFFIDLALTWLPANASFAAISRNPTDSNATMYIENCTLHYVAGDATVIGSFLYFGNIGGTGYTTGQININGCKIINTAASTNLIFARLPRTAVLAFTAPMTLSNIDLTELGVGGFLVDVGTGGNKVNVIVKNPIHPVGSEILVLADAVQPEVAEDEKFRITVSSAPITWLKYGHPGQTVTLLAETAVTITNGASIVLSGGANFVMKANDSLTLLQKTSGVWYEISRCVS